MTEEIALIIVFYNPSEEQLRRAERLSTTYHGAIIDNSPTPVTDNGSIGNMHYIFNNGNNGIAKAQNVGIRKVLERAKTRYIVFLDQDSQVSDSYPESIVNEYINARKELPNLATLGPVLTDGKNDDAYSSKVHKTRHILPRLILKANIISSGSCIERDTFDKVGLFEDRLFIDFVDSEWCWRAGSMGYVCCQTENVRMTHTIGWKRLRIGPINDVVSVPFRYFYQYRNYIWMLPRSYVPRKWKLCVGAKICCD